MEVAENYRSIRAEILSKNICIGGLHTSRVTFASVCAKQLASAFLPFCAQMKGSIKFPRRTVASITALGCIVGEEERGGGFDEEYQGLGRTNVGGEIAF